MADQLFEVTGKLLRKKKIHSKLTRLTIQTETSSDEQNDQPITILNVLVHKTNTLQVPSAFHILYLKSVLRLKGHVLEDDEMKSKFMAQSCTLVRCAPDVKMLKDVLSLDGYLAYTAELGMEGSQNKLQSLVSNNSRKFAIMALIRRLNGESEEFTERKRAKDPSNRLSHLKHSDIAVLEHMEREGKSLNSDSWTLCVPCTPFSESAVGRKKVEYLNLPFGVENGASSHGRFRRIEYLETKKNIQTEWFVRRIKSFELPQLNILDVGGGRGDLAVQIALSFPEANVTVVDRNLSSIRGGMEYAKKCQVDDRIYFFAEDFSDFVINHRERLEEINFVVALHACGDLSDMALSIASKYNCDFVICPCCYTKRYLIPFRPYWHTFCNDLEIDSLSRLAELSDRPEISLRSMTIINSLRKGEFQKQHVTLEKFGDKYSGRNLVLVGKNSTHSVELKSCTTSAQ